VNDERPDAWKFYGLDDEHTLVIGRIAAAFSRIEFTIGSLLFLPLVASDGWVGRFIAEGQPLSWILERVQRLAPFRLAPDLAAEVDSVVVRVRDASRHRNRVLHDAWAAREDRMWRVRFMRRDVEHHETTISELQAFADELVVLMADVMLVSQRVALQLWPDIAEEESVERESPDDPASSSP
jgi:hypothetical protein